MTSQLHPHDAKHLLVQINQLFRKSSNFRSKTMPGLFDVEHREGLKVFTLLTFIST